MGEADEEIAALKARLAALEGAQGGRRQPAKVKKGNTGSTLLTLLFCGFGLVTGVVACSNMNSGSAQKNEASNVASEDATQAPDSSPQTPPQVTHNYQLHEGDKYGYAPAVSEDDKKAGLGAATLLEFKYHGVVDGQYTLSDPTGVMWFSCSDPCQYIREWVAGDKADAKHIEFNPDTVAGSAMSDAINGQLTPVASGGHRRHVG